MLRHLKRYLLSLMALILLPAGMTADAQEVLIPESWEKKIYEIKPLYTIDTLTIVFFGDIMMHQAQINRAAKGEYTYFDHIEDRIREADIAVANMEFTLAGEPYTGYPCFSAPDSYAEYLADCGFDIFLTANNHIFDKGTQGTERTLETYRKLGIKFTGTAGSETEREAINPLIVLSKGIRLAFINMTYGTNLGLSKPWPKTNYIGERTMLGQAFSKAEENDVDFTIALPHWGTEYRLQHSPEQEEVAKWCIDNGADYIIGTHPHVIQDIEYIDGVPLVYSLGNAVSNMSAANTQLELMASIKIVRESNGDLHPLPLALDYLWCSRPGGYNDSYTVIPVTEFIGRREDWKNPYDYDNMVSTYERVKKETGIQ